jgi:hypothetical protein
MKIIITENKLFNTIYGYLDKKFNLDGELNWIYGSHYSEEDDDSLMMFDDYDDDYDDDDDDDNYDDNDTTEDMRIYFNGTWLGEDDSDIVFRYFNEDYYANNPTISFINQEAPVLAVTEYYELTDMFDEYWKEPMKKWFEDKFGLPVKTIEYE